MLVFLPTLWSHVFTDVSKCEVRNQGVYEGYRLNATLDWLIFNDRAETKLAMLPPLCCGEIVKRTLVIALSRSKLQGNTEII